MSCKGCIHLEKHSDKYPCRSCSRINTEDKYESKEEVTDISFGIFVEYIDELIRKNDGKDNNTLLSTLKEAESK